MVAMIAMAAMVAMVESLRMDDGAGDDFGDGFMMDRNIRIRLW